MKDVSPKQQAKMAISWNMIGFIFTFLNGVFTARILAPDERGVLATLLTISSLSYILSGLGTSTAVRTFQPSTPAASFRSYFLVSAKLLILNSLVAFAVVFWFTFNGIIDFSSYYFSVWILTALTFTSSQLLDVLNASGFNSQSARTNTIGHALTALALTIAFFGGSARLGIVIGAYTLGFLARIVAIAVFIRRQQIELGKIDPSDKNFLLKKGLRFWGMSLGQTLTFRSDQLLLSALSTTYDVGVYAVASTPAGLIQIVSNSLGQVLFREAAVKRLTGRVVIRWLGLIILATVAYGIVLALLAPWVIPLVFGADYTGSVSIVQILLIGEVFLSIYNVLVRVLAGFNRPLLASASSTVGLVAMVVSFLLLVPNSGAIGAAAAAVISYTFMAVVVSFGLWRVFQQENGSSGTAS